MDGDYSSDEDDFCREKGKVQSRPVFHVGPMPLHYTQPLRSNQQSHAAQKACQMNLKEAAIPFWRTEYSWTNYFSHLDFQGHGEVPTTHVWWKNQLTEIPRLILKEKVMVVNCETPRKDHLLHPKQKSVHWIKDLVCRFSRPTTLVIDVFLRTFRTLEACLRTLHHRCFVECEIDKDCFEKSVQGLV